MLRFIFLWILVINFGVAKSFSDIVSHENQEAIDYVFTNGIVEGYSDQTYRPDLEINRAEFTKIIVSAVYAAEEINQCDTKRLPFSDVAKMAWFAPFVCIAYEENIISGYPDRTFRPAANISFVEAAKIIDIAYDGVAIGAIPWYDPYVKNLSEFGVIPTSIRSLDKPITRGEMAEIIWRWEQEIEDKNFMGYDNGKLVALRADEFIFGYEAVSAEDCESEEVYDAEYEMCFLAEDLETQVFLDENFGDFSSPSHGHRDSYESDPDVLVRYKIKSDRLSLLDTDQFVVGDLVRIRENTKLHQQIWNQFNQLIPNHRAKAIITEFALLGGTGENEGTLAYVHQLEDNPKQWLLAINVPENFNLDGTLKNPSDFYYTLVHEFMHVVSLEERNTTNDLTCETYEIETGCLRPEAPLGRLVEDFWKTSPHWYDFLANPEDEDLAYTRFSKTPDRFVSDYAATNPGEDIAETFAVFVLQTKPSSDLVKDQKVLAMYEDEGLVKLRQGIRTNLTKMEVAPIRKRQR